ncbi:hypothetical protein MKEN_00252200 [Mycena kentingensis (nom. inval.)]|nr:hypothetical protein MKEN_00252200 [Mycena kentingensis (nom. inval.)]
MLRTLRGPGCARAAFGVVYSCSPRRSARLPPQTLRSGGACSGRSSWSTTPEARMSQRMSRSPCGYILENSVVHARLLPTTHAFTYPTFSFFVSLNALEAHSLDLARGWVFGYGGRWGRVFGLRAAPYLTPGHGSIKQKLEDVLKGQGRAEEALRLDDAWMYTMPSLLGFEGINPLTVYFCYDAVGELFIVVLEVHNTFGENHVYCLKLGENEDADPPSGFDLQWTFRRAFHVSPFNDRSGFYTVSVRRPTHPPSGVASGECDAPRPSVRVHLLTEDRTLKLTALLRPVSASPLTTIALLHTLAKYPFDLFLSFARIVYHAYILHYRKRLDVFIRPEPIPQSGGVRWQPEGILERYARNRVEDFLRRRVEGTGITVQMVPSDVSLARQTFAPIVPLEDGGTLTVSILAARAYTLIFVAPSAEHALLLGKGERVFSVSDPAVFKNVFSSPSTTTLTFAQRLRRDAACAGGAPSLSIPSRHPLDATLMSTAVLCLLLFLDRLEKLVFNTARARPVEGNEPWGMWRRAAAAASNANMDPIPRHDTGSVLHPL